jgi:predicted transcriptional regulator
MLPFAAYIKRRWNELGTLRATADQLGLHPTAVSYYARGLGTNKRPKPTIQRSTVERALECDGLNVEDIYESELEAELERKFPARPTREEAA